MSEADKTQYWLNLAQYDLDSAKIMLNSKRYLYVGFMCHQTIEKALKGTCACNHPNEVPPYTHNLIRLSDASGIANQMSEAQLNLLADLNPLYIESRYSQDMEAIHKSLTHGRSTDIYNETEALYEWIRAALCKA